jgi:3alpha(or 20beta)-hydroxysteroid dehydrogenase
MNKQAASPRAAFADLDVRDVAAWSTVVRATIERFGRIDILIANAGVASGVSRFLEETEDQHRKLLDVNVTGCWLAAKAVLPEMAKRGSGAIVFVSSIDGLVGVAGMATYTASKFAVTSLMRSLALESGTLGVRVNAVHPGVIATPLVLGARDAVHARLNAALAHHRFRGWADRKRLRLRSCSSLRMRVRIVQALRPSFISSKIRMLSCWICRD